MITNDEQLAIVKDQVQRLESGLKSLEETVRPKSEKQYQIFAEGWVDQLEIFRSEIAAYESRGVTQPSPLPLRAAPDSAVKA